MAKSTIKLAKTPGEDKDTAPEITETEATQDDIVEDEKVEESVNDEATDESTDDIVEEDSDEDDVTENNDEGGEDEEATGEGDKNPSGISFGGVDSIEVESKKPIPLVKIRMAIKHDCSIGGEEYHLERDKCYNVPENVKQILGNAGMLKPL